LEITEGKKNFSDFKVETSLAEMHNNKIFAEGILIGNTFKEYNTQFVHK
jgi:hypothetical protein